MMCIDYDDKKVYFNLIIEAKWDYIPLTKEFVAKFLKINSFDKRKAYKIEMVTSELLENSIKNSNDENVELSLLSNRDDNSVEVHVYNHADFDKYKQLKSRIDDMNSHEPFDYYVNIIKNSIAKKEKLKRGLGLARVNYEGSAHLNADYDDSKGLIDVRALFNS